MANVRTTSMTFPYPLGKVYPGANFAIQSVPLTQNITPVAVDNATPERNFNGIWIQASKDNTDVIYVCSTDDAPDLVNKTNILAELSAGDWYPRSKEWANNRRIDVLYIGALNALDHAIVSIDQF